MYKLSLQSHRLSFHERVCHEVMALKISIPFDLFLYVFNACGNPDPDNSISDLLRTCVENIQKYYRKLDIKAYHRTASVTHPQIRVRRATDAVAQISTLATQHCLKGNCNPVGT